MSPFERPEWSSTWFHFSEWQDLPVAILGSLVIVLLIVWWRQQTNQWFRIALGTLLAALLLSIASYYLFVVPIYYAGCGSGCPGWRGYPRPFAVVDLDGAARMALLDFVLNTLLLWLFWLGATLVWRILGTAFQWERRSLQVRLFFVFATSILPWALLPRLITPPQPEFTGEYLRLAVNAERSAQFTYRILGLWVHQLAVEDVQRLTSADLATVDVLNRVGGRVCLRGYTYFFFPWRRYRVDLDAIGVTALRLVELPLNIPCWERPLERGQE